MKKHHYACAKCGFLIFTIGRFKANLPIVKIRNPHFEPRSSNNYLGKHHFSLTILRTCASHPGYVYFRHVLNKAFFRHESFMIVIRNIGSCSNFQNGLVIMPFNDSYDIQTS